MKKLLEVPQSQRDPNWEDQFLVKLTGCSFRLQQDHPINGPDNMPYLPVQIVERGEPAVKVLRWLSDKGVGLVVNPEKMTPDYVLTFGMVWNFIENGKFIEKSESKVSAESFEITEGQQLYAGLPSDTYLPRRIRKIIREFLKEQGIPEPKIVLLSQNNEDFDLCFSAESLGNPPAAEWRGILEGFSWFFPLHYSLSILSEQSIKDFQFVEL